MIKSSGDGRQKPTSPFFEKSVDIYAALKCMLLYERGDRMKIMAVCEATGLTDRAVRYYIEEGLIDPDYTENYLGRRNYDFSDADVHSLGNIVVLRKYGFSVSEIHTISKAPEQIAAICSDLIERKRKSIADDGNALLSLEGVLKSCPRSIDELAAALTVPAAPVPSEDSAQRAVGKAGRIFPAVAYSLPILLAVLLLIQALRSFRYIVLNEWSLVIMCAALVPSVLGFILPSRIKDEKKRRTTKTALAVICFVLLPLVLFSGLFLSFRSQTDRLTNYLYFDDTCRASGDGFFYELFPSRMEFLWSRGTPLRYHYCDHEDIFGHKSDIYAEMTLTEEDLEKEIDLQRDGFEYYYRQHASDWIYYGGKYGPTGEIALKYTEFTHGRFACIAFYTEAEPFADYQESRSVYLFAYDPMSLTVRYAFYESDDWFNELPFYATVSWD